MLLRISFVIGMLCVWCVIGETMPKVINNHLKDKNDTKFSMEMDSKVDEKARQPRQLDAGPWNPIQPPRTFPAVWNARAISPLRTWWGGAWPFDYPALGAMIRVYPSAAFLPPELIEQQIHEHGHLKHHDHHKHIEHYEHKPYTPFHHNEHHHLIQRPLPAPFVHGIQATYIAQNPGAIHIAPLLGHTESVIASNLQAIPGTIASGPFPSVPGTVAIDGGIFPGSIASRPIAPPIGSPAPFAQPAPLARTW